MHIEHLLCQKLDPSGLVARVDGVERPIGGTTVAEFIQGMHPCLRVLPRPDLDQADLGRNRNIHLACFVMAKQKGKRMRIALSAMAG